MAAQLVRQAPGGRSTICLGTEEPTTSKAQVSSNSFARGSDQNSGNFITDRPSTGLHAPPGGRSTICLGTDSQDWKAATAPISVPISVPPVAPTVCLGMDTSSEPAEPKALQTLMSSNSFARGSDQNSGNFITDRPSTGLHAPPGGRSTLCLGTDNQDWKASSRTFASSAIAAATAEAPTAGSAVSSAGALILGAEKSEIRAPPGGRSTLILGAGPEEKKAPQAALAPAKEDVKMASPTKEDEVAEPEDVQMESPLKKSRMLESPPVKVFDEVDAAQAAGQRRLIFEQEPTPLRAGSRAIPGRAPPGGKATVLLG